jgi:hypothetical protein
MSGAVVGRFYNALDSGSHNSARQFRVNDRLFEHGSLQTTEVLRQPDRMVSSWRIENH